MTTTTQPTPAQIAAGVAKAKEMLAKAPLPSFIAHQITDDQIAEGITEIATAILSVPIVPSPNLPVDTAAPSIDNDDSSPVAE
jgi:hypothetical protein